MRLWTIILAAALVGGCAKGPVLEPAPTAQTMDGDAVDMDADVQVTVNPSDWFGLDLENEPKLVRLKVTIDNQSNRPLHLAYDHIMLVGNDGQTWQAIDPKRPDMIDLNLMDELLERSTLEPMVEDVAGTSGRIAGYVYFRDVTADRVTFQMDLVDATTGNAFGEISIPFTVENPSEGTTVSDAD